MNRKILTLLFFSTTALCHAQVEVDTVYLFPDTTTFLNETFIYTANVGNAAVRFNAPDNWESYKIDKLLVLVPDSSVQGRTNFTYTISIGSEPLDSILFESGWIPAENYFPTWWEINVEPEIEISQTDNFFISGEIPMWICKSYDLDSLIMNQFLLIINSESRWHEVAFPSYYALKVVVKNTTTGINDEAHSESSFYLSQNFPNPFNPSTTIKYSIIKAGKVKLTVYDILGREVIVLADEVKEPGFYVVNFSAKGGSASGGNAYPLSSGVYFYRIISGSFVSTRKMLLVK